MPPSKMPPKGGICAFGVLFIPQIYRAPKHWSCWVQMNPDFGQLSAPAPNIVMARLIRWIVGRRA
jgi:hypothetical protein